MPKSSKVEAFHLAKRPINQYRPFTHPHPYIKCHNIKRMQKLRDSRNWASMTLPPMRILQLRTRARMLRLKSRLLGENGLSVSGQMNNEETFPPRTYYFPLCLGPGSDCRTENGSPITTTKEETAKFGFQRPEMYSSNLAQYNVDAYDHHVFLCYECPRPGLRMRGRLIRV